MAGPAGHRGGLPSEQIVGNMAQALVTALTREIGGNLNTSAVPSSSSVGPFTSTSTTGVNQALKRQFPNLFNKSEAKRGKSRISSPSCPKKFTNLAIYVLPGPTDITPRASEELVLAHAGLGKRVLAVSDESKHQEIVRQMEEEFIKLKPLNGRWMFYKASGGGGQRKLSLIPMDADGYSGQQLRSASNNGKIVVFLVPLQEDMDTEPLPFDAAEFSRMPQVPCVTCNTTMPLQMLALHAGQCKPISNDQTFPSDFHEDGEYDSLVEQEAKMGDLGERECCPVCQRDFLKSVLPFHASECCDRSFSSRVLEVDPDVPGPSSATPGAYSPAIEIESTGAWKEVKDPQKAIELFLKQLKQGGEHQRTLVLTLDARDTDEERDMSLISFYKHKRDNIQWAAPFHCRIQGDAAVGRGVTRHIISSAIAKLKKGFKMNFGNAAVTAMFEGETDHLVPTTSAVLVESELFVMAGRLIGHSVINSGPAFSGLSLAVVHALTSGSKELATTYLSLEDCPDIDHRETIGLKRNNGVFQLLKEEMTEEESSRLRNLCMEWYFPVPTKGTNKLLLLQQLLTHAVLSRLSLQIKHLKKGLKETGIWPLIISRPDVVPLLFPRESEVEVTPQMVLQSVIWPQVKQTDESEDSEDLESETMKVAGFFHQFVKEASSDNLRQLMRFWVGWEVPCKDLKLEIVQSTGPRHLPTSSTCSERLRLPSHYSTYSALLADMMVCLKSVETGFGLV